jgi:hypothetical protein
MLAEVKARPRIQSAADVLDEASVCKAGQVTRWNPARGKFSRANKPILLDKRKSRPRFLPQIPVS